jgi:hypothetical protein
MYKTSKRATKARLKKLIKRAEKNGDLKEVARFRRDLDQLSKR